MRATMDSIDKTIIHNYMGDFSFGKKDGYEEDFSLALDLFLRRNDDTGARDFNDH